MGLEKWQLFWHERYFRSGKSDKLLAQGVHSLTKQQMNRFSQEQRGRGDDPTAGKIPEVEAISKKSFCSAKGIFETAFKLYQIASEYWEVNGKKDPGRVFPK